MKITRIAESVKNRINISSYIKKERELDKYVELHDLGSLNSDAFNKLNDARGVIANFAKKNNVKVDVFNSHLEKDGVSDYFILKVSKDNGRWYRNKLMHADTSTTYNYKTKNSPVLSHKDKAGNPSLAGSYYSEDDFLRNIYRTIENFTNKLNRSSEKRNKK